MSFLQTYLVILPCITTIEPHRPINIQCMLKLCVVCCFSSIQQSLICRHSWHRFIFLQNPVQLRSLESVFSFLIKFRMRQCDIVLVAWFFFFFFFLFAFTHNCASAHTSNSGTTQYNTAIVVDFWTSPPVSAGCWWLQSVGAPVQVWLERRLTPMWETWYIAAAQMAVSEQLQLWAV